jgi:hypothetical protein
MLGGPWRAQGPVEKIGTEPDIDIPLDDSLLMHHHPYFSDISKPSAIVIPLLTSLFFCRPGVPSRTDLVKCNFLFGQNWW